MAGTVQSDSYVNSAGTGAPNFPFGATGIEFSAGYTTTPTAAGTTTLTSSSTGLQFFTGSTTQTVLLPVVSTLTQGEKYTVVNQSTGIVTVQSSGANTIVAQPANTEVTYTCILVTGTTAASWFATNSVRGLFLGAPTGTNGLSSGLYLGAISSTVNQFTMGNSVNADGFSILYNPTSSVTSIAGNGVNPSLGTGFNLDSNNRGSLLHLPSGTIGPSSGLYVGATSSTVNYVTMGNNTGGDGFSVLYNSSTGAMTMATNGADPASVNGFGITATSILTGTITNWGTSATQAIGFSVTTGAGQFQKLTSSARYKKDFSPLSFDSSKIYDLSAKEFTWKENDKRDFGGIAEEVAAILPMAVVYSHDSEGDILGEDGKPQVEAIKYNQITFLLIEELKKLRDRIDVLEGKKAKAKG